MIIRIIMRFLLTTLIVYLLSTYVDQYFALTRGVKAIFIIGALLTVMNVILRPVLSILLAPFHFLFGFLVTIAMNLFFVWLLVTITSTFDPALVTLAINGGVTGWIIIAIIVGIANTMIHFLTRSKN